MSVVYQLLISTVDKFVPDRARPLWTHPTGPKTIFFWAPIGKWLLILAGLKDMRRPVEKVSMPQSLALAGTGMVWSRYSLVIKPKNYNLFSVNFTVGLMGIYQVLRVMRYRRSKEKAKAKE